MRAIDVLRSSTRRWNIGLINGTNMSNLINRNPKVFGRPQTIEELENWIKGVGDGLNAQIHSMHSDHDGEFIAWINAHAYDGRLHGFIINPAGLTTYAEHVRHCLHETGLPYVEVHYANLAVSGHNSVFTKTAVGMCHGLRKHSYVAALTGLLGLLDESVADTL